jgi:SAM-dependent methyltransferase
MHKQALDSMKFCLDRLVIEEANVLDIGSYDVNGTFRPLVEERGWKYTGLDIRPGPNVDIVSENPYKYPPQANTYDAVICGGMLHNCEEFWRVIPEMVRVLKPSGLLAVFTHTYGKPPSGKYPADNWRFMPDGIRYLFDKTGKLEQYDIQIVSAQDIMGSAFKHA